jgi:TetR/AcrR family transcriptional regulator, cholesterol catabolism regulator
MRNLNKKAPAIRTRKRLTCQERREQILMKAAEVFAVRGLASARTKEIADACGVNEALLYKHFQSKEELFCEAMGILYRGYGEKWKQAGTAAPNGLAAIQAVVNAQIENLLPDQIHCSNMVHAVASSCQNESMQDSINSWFGVQHDLLAEMALKGKMDGSIRSDLDPDAVATLVRAFIWGLIVFRVVHFREEKSQLEIKNDFKEIVNTIRNPSNDAGQAPDCGSNFTIL